MSELPSNEEKIERNQYLRDAAPGDELTLECWDKKTRSVEVVSRIELGNGSVVLKADGHGTRYQIDVPSDSMGGAEVRLRTAHVSTHVDYVEGQPDPEALWSDTTAADLGIEGL